jgi:hypothetical protein
MLKPSSPLRRALVLALPVMGCAALAVAHGATPASNRQPTLDQGRFVIMSGGKRVGTEDFTFRILADSLCLLSKSLTLQDPGDGKADTVDKQVFMAVGKDDYMLHTYQSNQTFRGKVQVRGIVMGDTLFTLYREYDGHGQGDRLVLPPGRMYVMDSRLYSLFELLFLSLQGQTFQQRPVLMLALGDRDTLVEATVARAGRDTLQIGGKPTVTARWRLSQGPVTLDMWTDAKGRVMRIAHRPTGLVVERQPEAVKPSHPSTKPGG